MWRYTVGVLLIGGVVGCVSIDTGPETGGVKPNYGKSYGPPAVPGLQGPHGEKVPMAAPYSMAPTTSPYTAAQMMSQNIPLKYVQQNPAGFGPMGGLPGAGMPGMPVPPGGIITPPGMPFAPGGPPGPGPGANQTSFRPSFGPGGVVPANIPPGMMPPGNVIQAQAFAPGVRFPASRTQVRFLRPSGMRVAWFTVGPDGKPGYSTTLYEAPFKYNFAQGAIYRLKLGQIEGRPGLDVYPTMEVVPCNPKVDAFLAHSSVPVEFTPEDFKQVAEGNYLVKVIYLPDPQFQDEAGPGLGEIISTRLEPGQDPIQEALRRGSILLVIRMGNVDQEAPNTPPLAMPAPLALPPQFGPGPNVGMPLMQVPYLGMPGGPKFGPMPPPGAALPPGFPGMAPPHGTAGAPANQDPRGLGMAPVPGAPFTAPSMPLPPNGTNLPPTVGAAPPPALPPIFPGLPPAPPGLPRLNGVPPVGADQGPPAANATPEAVRPPATLTGTGTGTGTVPPPPAMPPVMPPVEPPAADVPPTPPALQ